MRIGFVGPLRPIQPIDRDQREPVQATETRCWWQNGAMTSLPAEQAARLSLPDDRAARALVLSSKTVRNHVSNIFAKLRVADRAESIVRARQAGMGH